MQPARLAAWLAVCLAAFALAAASTRQLLSAPAGDCMGRFDTVARRCPSWRAQVTQLASFMALPRSPAEQQAFMDGQTAPSAECCHALRPFIVGGCSCDLELGRLWLAVVGGSKAQLDHSMRMMPKACKDLTARDNPCCTRDTTLQAPC